MGKGQWVSLRRIPSESTSWPAVDYESFLGVLQCRHHVTGSFKLLNREEKQFLSCFALGSRKRETLDPFLRIYKENDVWDLQATCKSLVWKSVVGWLWWYTFVSHDSRGRGRIAESLKPDSSRLWVLGRPGLHSATLSPNKSVKIIQVWIWLQTASFYSLSPNNVFSLLAFLFLIVYCMRTSW